MKVRSRWVIGVGALLLLIAMLGCNLLSPKEDGGTSSGGGASGPKVLFEDDFSDEGIWATYEDDEGRIEYVNGRLEIEAKIPQFETWSLPDKRFSDFVLEVDATQIGGPDDNAYGVILRYQDRDNFYEFDISGDGYILFGKFENDEWVSILDWEPSPAVKQGLSTNHIRVICKGNHFTFFVNGQKVGEATDSSFSSGQIGLAVSTNDEGGAAVAFDNLRVLEAP